MSNDLILMPILDDLFYLKFVICNGSKSKCAIDGFENIVGGIGLSSLNKHNSVKTPKTSLNEALVTTTMTNTKNKVFGNEYDGAGASYSNHNNNNNNNNNNTNTPNDNDEQLNNCILLRATEVELSNCLKRSYVIACCDKNKWFTSDEKYKISISINGSKYHHFYNYNDRVLNIANIPKLAKPNENIGDNTTIPVSDFSQVYVTTVFFFCVFVCLCV